MEFVNLSKPRRRTAAARASGFIGFFSVGSKKAPCSSALRLRSCCSVRPPRQTVCPDALVRQSQGSTTGAQTSSSRAPFEQLDQDKQQRQYRPRFSAGEWHRSRRREVLAAHPEVRKLIGSDSWVLSLAFSSYNAWALLPFGEMNPLEQAFQLWGIGSVRSTWAVYCSHAISHGRWSSLVGGYGSTASTRRLHCATSARFGVPQLPAVSRVRTRTRGHLCALHANSPRFESCARQLP